MRATFRYHHDTGLLRAFLWSILLGGTVKPTLENPNTAGDMSGFDVESLRLVIEEGRRQLDSQSERFRHATDRAKSYHGCPPLLGFLGAQLDRLGQLHGDRHWLFWAVWGVAAFLSLAGTAAAAATVVVKADFEGVDTTRISTWTSPGLRTARRGLRGAVRTGEVTVAARVTVFRQATRITVWGAVSAAEPLQSRSSCPPRTSCVKYHRTVDDRRRVARGRGPSGVAVVTEASAALRMSRASLRVGTLALLCTTAFRSPTSSVVISPGSSPSRSGMRQAYRESSDQRV